jgi:hypothetical protein
LRILPTTLSSTPAFTLDCWFQSRLTPASHLWHVHSSTGIILLQDFLVRTVQKHTSYC